MPLNKQTFPMNFSQGLDLKTDPKQVGFGKFLRLVNSVFQKTGLMQKRNGYGELPALPDSTSIFTTTFNGNLTAIGNKLEAFSEGSDTWVNKGSIQPLALDVLPLIRTNNNQSQADAAVAPNGLICTAYTDNVSGSPVYKYVVADSETGQNVLAPTVITNGSGSPKVFVLGNYFVIVFTSTIAATPHLQFIAINTTTLIADAAVDISTSYTPASTVAFDGVVANNSLFVAWNGSDIGGAIRMTYIDSMLTQHSTVVFATYVATIMSVTADTSSGLPVVYASFYDLATSTAYTLAVNQILGTVLAPTEILSTGTILNITSAAQAGVVSIYYETSNAYSYDANVKSNFVSVKTVTQAGVVSSPTVVLRSVGLASKAFIISSVIYFLVTYSSSYQPTYFLITSSGNIISKLAYSNAGGYLTLGLPNASVTDNVAQIPYLIRDLIEPVNKEQQAPSNGLGVYTQTGINLSSFTIGTSNIIPAEIGSNLHLTGGFMWMYDGYQIVEHGFHVWPDNVEIVGSSASGSMIAQQYYYQVTYEWSDNQGNIHRSAPSLPVLFEVLTPPVSFTGNRTSGSPILASVSSTANLQVGQAVSGTGIPASTFILSIDSSSQITLTHNATSGTATSTTITPVAITSATVNVPTLRLTYKTANPVKIVIYRWSEAQETFYQTTTLTTPVVNSTTTDSVSFTDTHADSSILGNSIIYTTGGVVENIAAPSLKAITLFKERLFGINAENENELWYSKQVIASTPVEMSDLFTLYVAPTLGSQGSTGPMKCLAAMDDKLILFKPNAIYYQTGNGPNNTGAENDLFDPTFITSTVGCSNQQSIVFIPQGLMFQSDKGIWLLGRDLSTNYIGAAVEDFNSYQVQSALNIPGTNQVRFTLSNGVTLMYDYFYNQWGSFYGVPAISSTLYQNLHTYINAQGKVFQENPGSFLDGSNPVLMSFTTSWINLAGLQGFERAYWLYLIGKYISPHRLAVSIAYDYNDSPTQLTQITPDNYTLAYGDAPLYGSTEFYGGSGNLEQWNLYFQKQKCQSFQVTVNEVYDSTFGVVAGEGLTLSGLSLTLGMKGQDYPLKASRSVG